MLTVLTGLRVLIGMGSAFFVWFLFVVVLGVPDSLVGVLLPVWLGGLVGGVVCSLFSMRQGITMAFVCGVLLAVGFLWYRHVIMDMPLGENTFVTLWPVWFPASFYVGAFGYIQIMSFKGD